MPIQFQCPHCGHSMQLPDAAAGKQGKCPKCQGVVTVPAGVAAAPASPEDEEFWSEVGEEKKDQPVEEEEESHGGPKQTDAQLLKMSLGKADEEKKIKRIGLPWENPSAGGMMERYWDTAIAVMNHPATAFGEMRLTGGIKKALIYLILGAVFGSFFGALYVTIGRTIAVVGILGVASDVADEEDEESAEVASTVITAAAVIGLVIVFFAVFIGGAIATLIHTFLQTLLLHGTLSVAGIKDKDFERTFRITAFSCGSIQLCYIVPGLGVGFMLLLWFIAMFNGIKAVYGATDNQTTTAVLLLFVPLLLPIVVGGGFLFFTLVY
ncbi:MAG: hypothetical protein CMJ64_04955 [Planctomycetaceae bacterium]|nr:hypothetical protein [Planctomycetaceae bacterium]